MNALKPLDRIGVQAVVAIALAVVAFAAWHLEVGLLGRGGLQWLGAWRAPLVIAVCTGLALLLPYGSSSSSSSSSSSRGPVRSALAAILVVLVGSVVFVFEKSAIASIVNPRHLPGLIGPAIVDVVVIWLVGSVALWVSMCIGFTVKKRAWVAVFVAFPFAFFASIAVGMLAHGSAQPIEALKMGWWALLAPLCAWAASTLSTTS